MAGNVIVVNKDLLKSQVFRELSGIAKSVYFDFLMKCRVTKRKARPGRRSEVVILNNGELTYSYSEALTKGITRPRFNRGLRELVEKGFIDIEHSGSGGVKGDLSKYSISDRWRQFGSDDFELKMLPKDKRSGRGFARYWQKKNSIIGNAGVTPTGNAGVTS